MVTCHDRPRRWRPDGTIPGTGQLLSFDPGPQRGTLYGERRPMARRPSPRTAARSAGRPRGASSAPVDPDHDDGGPDAGDAAALAALQSDPTPWLGIKGWREFQHYRDRKPPWIKTYVALLDDRQFNRLEPAVQLILVKTWLLASKDDGRVAVDLPWISQRINLPVTDDQYRAAVRAGFLVPLNPAASAWLGVSESGERSPVLSPSASDVLARSGASPEQHASVREKTDRESVFDRHTVLSSLTAPSVVAYLDGPIAPEGRVGPRGSAIP